MTTPVPPSSTIPNFHDGIGLDGAKAIAVITQATRNHLLQHGITLKDPLGKPGAYGIVLAATDAMQRPLAVKVVLRPLDRQSRKRHQRESEILSWEKIPTDLRPYCHLAHKVSAPKDEELAKDTADGVQPYLVMSRIDGKEVHTYVGERHTTMPHRIALVRKLFEALHRLHKSGVVHGDISPRNLLIEQDDQVRFVDFGGGRDILKAGYSAQSAMAVGGTAGYAPRSQLTGEEQASINTDLRAMAAVAYDALTGTLHDDSLIVAEKKEKLKNAGVPVGIQKLILKGLQEPDKRVGNDPNVFRSAEEVVKALDAWELQMSRRKQLFVFGPLLTAVCILFAMAWWRLESEVANRYSETARVLREQVDAFGPHPATKLLIEKADEEIRTVNQREREMSLLQRRQRLDVAADILRQALDKGRKLEAILPRYNTLGTMWEKIRWQPDAKALSTLRTELQNEFLEIGKLLDQGNVDEAESKIEIFAGRLISAWEANELARTAAFLRSDLSRTLDTVPKRLIETPRFTDFKQDALRADEQWQSADTINAFDLAEKTYGNLQQRLGEWLEKEETTTEKSERLHDSQARVTRIAEQLQQAQGRNGELVAEINTLNSQITKQAELNQKDRLAKESAESQISALMAKQTAAESNLNQLKATLQNKLRIEKDLTQIQQQLLERTSAWESAQAQVAQIAKERDSVKEKADRLEKLLAARGSANPRDSAPVMRDSTGKTLGPGKTAGELWVARLNGIDIRFRWCPAGRFQMGSPSDEWGRGLNEHAVQVTHSRGFWIMETECWQALWVAVMGTSKSSTWTKYNGVGDRYPAYNISHDEATEFARKLNQVLKAMGVIAGYEVRLPTEAQWEYAVRAGSSTAYCFGDSPTDLDEYAWNNNFGRNTGIGPVGTKRSNAWGIHDGHGSMEEWCFDWYGSYPNNWTNADAFGPSAGADRVCRGGDWCSYREKCRSAYRRGQDPAKGEFCNGFRITLSSSSEVPY
jgi:formylglycine-generating enzyme required for sulfatase activity/serine/threonine protein kinase